MTDEDRRLLATGQCLTDTHVRIAAQILKNQFPEKKGLQDTIFVAKSRAEWQGPGSVQIHHKWLKPLGGFHHAGTRHFTI